jgi:hypothetical protein
VNRQDAVKPEEEEAKEAPRRWYRVHPITDELYFVRPDAGLAGRTVGHPDAGVVTRLASVDEDDVATSSTGIENVAPVRSALKGSLARTNSLPRNLDRMTVDDGKNFDFNDTFVNLCKLCFDKPADVVMLPCRHGGLCEECLRRSLFIKPAHKGGMSCPWCRKKIIEVIKMYGEGAINMYGYAISAGCFFEGKDDS